MIYLDPDSLVCGPLDDLYHLAREHDVLVRRRTMQALRHDGRRPNEADLRVWGLHDSGLLMLGAGGDHRALLDWWLARGPAGEPTPIDRIATFGDGAYELREDGLAASFWDLHGRDIAAREDSVLIDGAPLRLMRFPAFDPQRPLALSDAQNGVCVDDTPALAALSQRYARLLRGAGEEQAARGFDRLPDGTRLDHRLRTIVGRAIEEGALRHSPFTRRGMEERYAWLSALAATGVAFGISRLCLILCDLHPELREAYPNLDHDHHAFGLNCAASRAATSRRAASPGSSASTTTSAWPTSKPPQCGPLVVAGARLSARVAGRLRSARRVVGGQARTSRGR
jgi:hypothetical protein